jgi:alkylhydroperoxidase/carboxymuconolactone decarboxylase family protein YurZ
MKTVRLDNPENLTPRERYCTLVASYFAVGKRDATLKIMKRGMKNERLPERMFGELFLHLSLLLGFPAMLEGLMILRTIQRATNKGYERSVSANEASKQGRSILKRVYGNTLDLLLVNLKSLHGIVPEVIVRDVYGRIISRPGLSLREREIINVVVLSIQHLEQQLFSHIRGALRLRVDPKLLRTAILLAAKIAETDPSTSLQLLSSLAGSRKSPR